MEEISLVNEGIHFGVILCVGGEGGGDTCWVHASGFVQQHMSNGMFKANKAKTEVFHFCLKRFKTRYAPVKRDSKLPAFP